MDPFASGQLRIEPDDEPGLPPELHNGKPPPEPARLAARRADIEAKQTQVGAILETIGCEGVLLFLQAHVAWFTAGMNVRGLIADGERPGIYTNGRQRWLLCSNIDTQRLFDEELDRLGFQLKEWAWDSGRAHLLSDVVGGRKVAADRPFPNMPLVVDRLRPLLRVLSAFEQESYHELGGQVAHAVEATARNIAPGQTEEEVAGQLGHRLLHHGTELTALSVTADGRGAKFRRAGFTATPITRTCVIQATAQRNGLYATAARTVAFGSVPDEFHSAHDLAIRLAAIYFALTVPGESIGTARAAGEPFLEATLHEHEGRLSQPGYGAGRFPAEELRRAGQDERFADGQALVWQPRLGPAAVVDTVIVTADGADCVTAPRDWPFKRVKVGVRAFDISGVLVR